MTVDRAAEPTSRPRVVAGLRLLEQVGSGGEGEVWEARDERGRRCALKLVRPEVLPAPDEMVRRGAWLRQIDHPALVRVHRTGRLTGSSLDGWGFVEMDFIDGRPLGAAPADPDALRRLRPLAEALDLLHAGHWSEGVPLVHRDVKPANLIEQASGEVVLVDVSTLRGLDTTEVTRVGTPLFAAPEVMTGRAGPAADVYGFAATIVALVSGARGRELADLLADPDFLDLPPTVAQALHPDPAQRPGSCAAVLEASTTIAMPAADSGSLPLRSSPPPTGRWLAGLATVVGLSALAPFEPWDVPAVVFAAAAVGLHIGLTRWAGAPWALVPVVPAAWAWPLGARAAPPGRARAWTRLALLGVLTAALALLVPPVASAAAAAALEGLDEFAEPAAAVVGLVMRVVRQFGFVEAGAAITGAAAVLVPTVVAVGAGRGRRVLGVMGRLVLLPFWLLGLVLALLAGVGALALRHAGGRHLALGGLASSLALAGGWGSGRRPATHRADPRA